LIGFPLTPLVEKTHVAGNLGEILLL